MHKKPIYGSRIYSDRSNSDITFRDFLKKVIQHQRGLSGAAQNMDLFMHTRPLFTKFLAIGGQSALNTPRCILVHLAVN